MHPTTEGDLLRLISDVVEESLSMEYKGAAALGTASTQRNEMSKDVSAMLNAAGGVIIYGMAEHSRSSGKQHLPERLDPITDPKITKEWLEQVLNSTIRPRPLKIQIVPIRVDRPIPGTVFVLAIGAGETAHQANDQKYYRRGNFECTPMYDHEIRDVMGRTVYPVVNLNVVHRTGPAGGIPRTDVKYRWLTFSFGNNGSKLAKHVTAFVYVPVSIFAAVQNANADKFETRKGVSYARIALNLRYIAPTVQFGVGVQNPDPLLPGLSLDMKTIQLLRVDQSMPRGLKIVAEVYADEAPRSFDVIDVDSLIDGLGAGLIDLVEKDDGWPI